uniref:Uncharacterized protein n=1 Tax=Vespula pensylvanica TaxID=30213 RepID=A0A834JWN8_VESPE|nr:hypothetical protein H0235_016869 [Vespula pensylvanica]
MSEWYKRRAQWPDEAAYVTSNFSSLATSRTDTPRHLVVGPSTVSIRLIRYSDSRVAAPFRTSRARQSSRLLVCFLLLTAIADVAAAAAAVSAAPLEHKNYVDILVVSAEKELEENCRWKESLR